MIFNASRGTVALAILLGAANSVVLGESTVRLEVAAQASLANDQELLLVYSRPLDTSADMAAGFALVPPRTIAAAERHNQANNVVRLKLDPATPLVAGTVYSVRTINAKDADGEPLDPDLTSATLTATSLQREIDNIRACQIPDGALSTNIINDIPWRNGEPLRLVPYYGCIAAQGLIRASDMTRNNDLLPAARSYLQWHAARIPVSNFITDYTGWYPTYQSTGTYDSTDSYGALFASTLWKYFQKTGDVAFLADMYPALEKSVAAMDATLQPDGLTWATPDYKIKFTMDNTEVFQGYFAAAQLAYRSGQTNQYNIWMNKALTVRAAIQSQLYLSDAKHYSKGKSNTGNVYTDWSDYYPDGMANEFALYYTHFPTDQKYADAWASHKAKFFPDNVPAAGLTATSALAAARANDELIYELAFVRALSEHGRQNYAHESAKLIEAEMVRRERQVSVPTVATTVITIDGALSEPVWQTAPRLIFNRAGVANGYANQTTYEFPQNTIDPEGQWTVSWLRSGTRIYIGLDVEDRYITSADVATDSDGLSHLMIRNAQTNTILHQATYTFFPNTDAATVPTAPPGTILADPAVGNAAFSFKPGNNTPNNSTDLDTGYQLELSIDLSEPAAGNFPATADQIVIGLRLADMDGTPGQGWPWSNGAYGTMVQWSAGLSPSDYTVNTLQLLPGDQSSIHDWSIY